MARAAGSPITTPISGAPPARLTGRGCGHVAERRRVAVRAPVGSLRVQRRPEVFERNLSRHARRRAILPRHAAWKSPRITGSSPIRPSRRKTRIRSAPPSAPGRPWTCKSCATCSPTASRPPKFSARMPISASNWSKPARGSRRSRSASRARLQEWLEDWDAQARDQQHRHISHLYGFIPAPKSRRAARRNWPMPPKSRSTLAATSPPAGPSPGASTVGRGCTTATAPSASQASL